MKQKIIFVLAFVVLGFVALQIPVNVLAGAKVNFTLFDLFGPIAGAFLGTPLGIISVLATQIVNILVGGTAIDKSVIIRLLPTLFAVWVFARRDRLSLLIPVLAIISFNLHPVGRSVWFYSLFWTIPLLLWKFRQKSLLARSLAATFTAHAVGGAIWIWAFSLPAVVWTGLIPVVMLERSIFALGIAASFILMTNVFGYLSAKKLLPSSFGFEKKFLVKR
ncbi:MAG: hypothetical protein Q7S57_04755 [bacterium]|nr:hypothetical protein [bacterium]